MPPRRPPSPPADNLGSSDRLTSQRAYPNSHDRQPRSTLSAIHAERVLAHDARRCYDAPDETSDKHVQTMLVLKIGTDRRTAGGGLLVTNLFAFG